jgi:hypothetical protein
MRSLDERIAEIDRRSKKLLAERKKRRKKLLLGCVSLVLCLCVFTALLFPWRSLAKQDIPSQSERFPHLAQTEAEPHGTVRVYGPGMIRIHFDRVTTSKATYLLKNYASPAAECTEEEKNAGVSYQIVAKAAENKTKFRLSGNILEVSSTGRSYRLTEEQVSTLKGVLCIPDVSVTIQVWFMILAVMLILTVPVVSIRRIRKNTGSEKSPVQKRTHIIVFVSVLLVAVLSVPIPYAKGDPNRTHMQYVALTYKTVHWNIADGAYEKTAWYGFPDNFKSLDELWIEYMEPTVRTVTATVLQIDEDTVIAQPIRAEAELRNTDQLCFSKKHLAAIDPEVGDDVDIDYIGDILETYPVQIQALRWRMTTDLRYRKYSGQWLNPDTAKRYFEHNGPAFTDIRITEIYADCFIAQPQNNACAVKLNGRLSEEWNVGDLVFCTYETLYFDEENRRMEADMLTIKASEQHIEHIPFFQ